MKPIRVLLADDHALLRAGIAALLRMLEGIEVVGEASNGVEALQMARDLNPDVLLTDLSMPAMSGLEIVAQLAQEQSPIGVVVLSVHASEEYVLAARQAKVSGYLLKNIELAELDLALRTVAEGGTYFTPVAAEYLAKNTRRAKEEGAATHPLLTPRQLQILQMIALGKSTKEIARLLTISTKTVESHRVQLMDRLGIHDVASLVRYAIRERLVSLDE
jgi:DNA-binding NarL/FixJ family response regulator